MRPLPQLGPRAGILLGMLCSPMTAAELHRMCEQAVELGLVDDISEALHEAYGFAGYDPAAVVRSLNDGGIANIHWQLRTLESEGYASRLIVDDDDIHADLWYRLPL